MDWTDTSVFLSQCLQNPSSDIRLVAEKMIWWANKEPQPPLEPQAIKPILKALLDNTKDKNTVVRAYSDQAIVNLLKMRQGEELFQVGAWSGVPAAYTLGICPAALFSLTQCMLAVEWWEGRAPGAQCLRFSDLFQQQNGAKTPLKPKHRTQTLVGPPI